MKMLSKFPPLSGLPVGEVFAIMGGNREGFTSVNTTLLTKAIKDGKQVVFMDFEASVDPKALKALDLDLTEGPDQRGFMIGSERLA